MPRGKRRGEIHEAVARVFHLGRGGAVVVVDRGSPTGARRIDLGDVERVAADRLILRDGTVVPLHRVVEVVDADGRVVWRRGAGLIEGRGG